MYYDDLCRAGPAFIDLRNSLRSLGLGALRVTPTGAVGTVLGVGIGIGIAVAVALALALALALTLALPGLKEMFSSRLGTPVLNLDFLLDEVISPRYLPISPLYLPCSTSTSCSTR